MTQNPLTALLVTFGAKILINLLIHSIAEVSTLAAERGARRISSNSERD